MMCRVLPFRRGGVRPPENVYIFLRARNTLKTRVPLLFVLKIKTVVFREFRIFSAQK